MWVWQGFCGIRAWGDRVTAALLGVFSKFQGHYCSAAFLVLASPSHSQELRRALPWLPSPLRWVVYGRSGEGEAPRGEGAFLEKVGAQGWRHSCL